MAGFRVDDSDLVRQVAALRRTQPEVVKALRRGMREAGDDVRDGIRAAAGATRSRRIARSVKTATRIGASTIEVTVRADPKVAPHASVMEGGPDGQPGRHPVYARGPHAKWTWAVQRPRRFFRHIARAKAESARSAVFSLVSDAVRQSVRGRR